MRQVNQYFSWLTTVVLVLSTSGLDACGSNKSAPVTVAQTQPTDLQGQAQGQAQAQAQPQAAAPAAQNATADASQAQLPAVNLTADGLDELLAPIALYPDPVLAVMLQAAVNPQEVMDGGNWLALDENQNLKEAALDQASQKAGFTPVMQALLHYPTVVDLMCTQFDWTKQLGAAYQGNPKAVLDSVQRLRAQAVDNGALKSGPQMKVNVTQDQGQQVVKLEPTDPKTVYVPSYDPSRVYSTTTTTTSPNGTSTTTTTTNAPASASTSSSSSTTVVQQQSGVSTGTAVMIGLLSFGAGIALGAAISSNNYYYPAWGHGGVWYGPRPYYPPPYYPHYYGGWHGGYYYNRPAYYHQTNIYINNSNNYYNRFNNNNNLNPNYKPRPVPYNNNPNGVYAKSVGNRPATRQRGVTYQPKNNLNAGTGRPAPGNANVGARPAAGTDANNWKGQSTYKGRNPATTAQQPVGGANNRVSPGTMPNRNPSGDRGFGQAGGTRPTTGSQQYNRPAGGNAQVRPSPSPGNQPSTRPATTHQPAARPAQHPTAQPTSLPQNTGGAFGGASNPKTDRAASNRGHASMYGRRKKEVAMRRIQSRGMTMHGMKLMITFCAGAMLAVIPGRAADQKTFATAAEAAQALYKASAEANQNEIVAVLGYEGKQLVYSGDAVQDKRGMEGFVKAYKTKHSLVKQDDKTQILQVGANDWPLPIPIVNDGGKWRFDTAAGKEELMYRRIGHNELGAIAACRGFIDALKDYAAVGHDGLPAGIYAQKLMSTPGKQDGLYWETKEDEPARVQRDRCLRKQGAWDTSRRDWEESPSRITVICTGS